MGESSQSLIGLVEVRVELQFYSESSRFILKIPKFYLDSVIVRGSPLD